MTLFLPFSCALLTAGYATRSYGTYHNDDPQVYTASLLLIYAAPYVQTYTPPPLRLSPITKNPPPTH